MYGHSHMNALEFLLKLCLSTILLVPPWRILKLESTASHSQRPKGNKIDHVDKVSRQLLEKCPSKVNSNLTKAQGRLCSRLIRMALCTQVALQATECWAVRAAALRFLCAAVSCSTSEVLAELHTSGGVRSRTRPGGLPADSAFVVELSDFGLEALLHRESFWEQIPVILQVCSCPAQLHGNLKRKVQLLLHIDFSF